jgi:hypothetical protein
MTRSYLGIEELQEDFVILTTPKSIKLHIKYFDMGVLDISNSRVEEHLNFEEFNASNCNVL